MKILRNMKGANTETKVVYKNVTKIDVVCKKNVAKKIRNGLRIAFHRCYYCGKPFVSCPSSHSYTVHVTLSEHDR